jgi:hypothetical protein
MGIDFEPEDVWQISYDIENSEEYDNLVKKQINEKYKDSGREL